MDFVVLFPIEGETKGKSTHYNLLPKHNTRNNDLSAVSGSSVIRSLKIISSASSDQKGISREVQEHG